MGSNVAKLVNFMPVLPGALIALHYKKEGRGIGGKRGRVRVEGGPER